MIMKGIKGMTKLKKSYKWDFESKFNFLEDCFFSLNVIFLGFIHTDIFILTMWMVLSFYPVVHKKPLDVFHSFIGINPQ